MKARQKQSAGFWLSGLHSGIQFFSWVWCVFVNTTIGSYLARYWVLLVLLGLAVALVFSNVLFSAIGTLIYLPVLALGSLAVALLLRNVFNRETTDADADSGRFVSEWKKLDSRTRVILTVVQILVYFFGICLIASALIR